MPIDEMSRLERGLAALGRRAHLAVEQLDDCAGIAAMWARSARDPVLRDKLKLLEARLHGAAASVRAALPAKLPAPSFQKPSQAGER